MRLLHLLITTVFIGMSYGLCVFDNKHGWFVDCGLRDSFLFRLKDWGGIKANFDFGLGLGDSKGFPQAIDETPSYNKHTNHYRRSDAIYPPLGKTPLVRRPGQNQILRRQGGNRRSSLRAPLAPLPYMVAPLRRQDTNIIQQIPGRGNQPTIVITHDAPRPQPTASPLPTIGPSFGSLLNIDSNTIADTDHVPSFAAKMFVVREAPEEFFPPGYEAPKSSEFEQKVEVPRTKFFCEEQKYLPGIYADVQLGCKVFHLCLPAAMGNSMTSFMCPNMTLFDQSIMQCNFWYHVNCERAESHFEANLPMAISYRKINAAQIPLSAVRDMNNVALLSHNVNEMAEGSPLLLNNIASKRTGLADTEE